LCNSDKCCSATQKYLNGRKVVFGKKSSATRLDIVKHDTPVCTVILLDAILINIVAPMKNTFVAEKFYWKKLIFCHKNGYCETRYSCLYCHSALSNCDKCCSANQKYLRGRKVLLEKTNFLYTKVDIVKHSTCVYTVILLYGILINVVAPIKNTLMTEKFYWKK
jgi:hypothetical protein